MNKPKITIIAVNWWANDFAEILIESLFKNNHSEAEIIIVDNSKSPSLTGVRTIRPDINIGHGGGIDMGISEAKGEYILILDIDTHILLKDWDEILLEALDEGYKMACATDGGLLKPARPLAMFFKKNTIVSNGISFKAKNLDGVKFDVGLHAYFRILTEYGDNSILKLPYKKTDYEDVLGCEYMLNGKRFLYHNWYGCRWYGPDGKRKFDKIDSITWENFLKKKINLFQQL